MTRRRGTEGPIVFPLGLGCMGMSDLYGPADAAESVATIRAALDAGVRLLDTGDFYGMGRNELLIRAALAARDREEALTSVKFGVRRDADGGWAGTDCRPVARSRAPRRALGGRSTDAAPRRRGAPDQRPADRVLADLARHRGQDPAHVPRAGIAVTAYGVLSRGLLSGHWSAERSLPPSDFRANVARFAGQNLSRNRALVEALAAVAAARHANVAQTAIAWVLSRGDDIVPLIGARRRGRLQEALGALDLELGAEDLAQIGHAVPADAAAGKRYAPAQLAQLDSERSA